jgi:hypothetical protein
VKEYVAVPIQIREKAVHAISLMVDANALSIKALVSWRGTSPFHQRLFSFLIEQCYAEIPKLVLTTDTLRAKALICWFQADQCGLAVCVQVLFREKSHGESFVLPVQLTDESQNGIGAAI